MTIQIKATYSLKGWQGKNIAARIPNLMADYRKILDRQLKEDIQTPQFSWTGRETKRRNGTTVGSPRDIVDTGAFLRSQRAETQSSIGSTTITFSWGNDGVNYAGYILRGTTAAYPPRDWIRKALDKQPLDQFLLQNWRRYSRGLA